jgi:predicted transcriptional regulator
MRILQVQIKSLQKENFQLKERLKEKQQKEPLYKYPSITLNNIADDEFARSEEALSRYTKKLRKELEHAKQKQSKRK